MDITFVPHPQQHVSQTESGLVAGYCFGDNEIASSGRYINRSAVGAVYDWNVISGAPMAGQGGGLFAQDGSSYRGMAVAMPTGTTEFAYDIIYQQDAAAAALTQIFANGGWHLWYTRLIGAGDIFVTVNGGGSGITTPFSVVGRGPVYLSQQYRGGTHYLYCNNRLVGQEVVVASAPVVAACNAGRIGTFRRLAGYSGGAGASNQVRADLYVSAFAKRVLWQWAPRDVGEGPAGGILTGSCSGVGGWTCPLGAATMGFVWRGDRLALTDTQTVNLNRIDFEYGSRPWFGSFLVEYEVRDPATDSMVVGFTPRRGVDPTVAASGSYWLHVRQVAGPWWRSSVYLANGAQIDAADTPTLPVVGDRGKVLFTRDVDGTIQVWSYLQSTGGWWWSAATGTDATVLPEGCITIAPRGAYVERVTWFQGAASPHELGIRVP